MNVLLDIEKNIINIIVYLMKISFFYPVKLENFLNLIGGKL